MPSLKEDFIVPCQYFRRKIAKKKKDLKIRAHGKELNNLSYLGGIDPKSLKILIELKVGETHHLPCDSKN